MGNALCFTVRFVDCHSSSFACACFVIALPGLLLFVQVRSLLAGEVTLPKGDWARDKTIREYEEIVKGLRTINSSYVHVEPPIAVSFTFPSATPGNTAGQDV